MAFTQSDVDSLKSAIARGARRVRINGEEVEYASMAELMRALALVEQEVAGAVRGAFSVTYPNTGRGL